MTTAAPPFTDLAFTDLDALRARTLDQFLPVLAVLLTLGGTLSFARNLTVDWHSGVMVNLPVILLAWLLALGRRRLSYRWKVLALLLLLWLLATNALLMVGPAANAKSLIILIVLMAVLFLGTRAGWLSLGLGALTLGALGAASVTGLTTVPIDYPRYIRTPVVWLHTVYSFTAYGALTAFVAARLIQSLHGTVEALNARTRTLRETQARLHAVLRQQRAIFDNTSAGIALIDGEQRIKDLNPRFGELLGYPPADLIGCSTRRLFRDPVDFENAGQRFFDRLEEAGTYSEDLELCRRDGAPIWTHASLSPLEQGRPQAGVVLVLVDIRQRRRRELAQAFARRRAESATRAKSRLLVTVTHELRTPLHAILGFSAILERMEGQAAAGVAGPDGTADADADAGPLESQRRHELLASIHRRGQCLLELVNELLDQGSTHRGRLGIDPRPTALPALLRDCVGELAPLAAAKGLALHLDLDPGLPGCVRLDGRRLGQIVGNLLGNAIKVTVRGEVRLGADARPDPGDPARITLELCVSDTGPGIPPADQARVFEAFARAAPAAGGTPSPGTGLGLAISRGLARRMGGDIHLASAPGAGSRFTLILPGVPLVKGRDTPDPERSGLPPAASFSQPAALPPPPPPESLAELRGFAELGRTSRIESWCRHWSAPGGRPEFAAQVLALAHAFEHDAILALADTAAGAPDHPAAGPAAAESAP